jgi:hypothetical protein
LLYNKIVELVKEGITIDEKISTLQRLSINLLGQLSRLWQQLL